MYEFCEIFVMMSRFTLFGILLAVTMIVGCSKSDVPENRVFSVKDLANKKVGVIKGTTAEAYARDFESESGKMILESFPSLEEMVVALSQGELDAVLSDDVPAKMTVENNETLRILNETLKEESYAGVIAKGNMGLLDSVNMALIQMRATGVYDSIVQYYVAGGPKYHFKPGVTNGPALKVATYAKFPPFVYHNDKHELVGSDVDIVRYVANLLERPVVFIEMEFGEIIGAVRNGEADLGFAAFSVTDERREIIDFTDNYATSKIVVIVRSGETKSFFQQVKDSLLGK